MNSKYLPPIDALDATRMYRAHTRRPRLGNKGNTRAAGRPVLPVNQRQVNVAVSLLPFQIEWARQFGEDNLSRGVRKAIAVAMQVQAAKAASAEELLTRAGAGELCPDTGRTPVDAPPIEGPPAGGWVDEAGG